MRGECPVRGMEQPDVIPAESAGGATGGAICVQNWNLAWGISCDPPVRRRAARSIRPGWSRDVQVMPNETICMHAYIYMLNNLLYEYK